MDIIYSISLSLPDSTDSISLPVFNSLQEPLFLVNDVVTGLIGLCKITHNQVFKDSKEDVKYVREFLLSDLPQTIQNRYRKSNKHHTYLFTETGLYRCLFRSNIPRAEHISLQIVTAIYDMKV